MKHLLPLLLIFLASCSSPTFEQAGGLRMTLEARISEDASEKEVKEQMDRAKLILAKRLEEFGVKNANVKSGETVNYIMVEIPMGKRDHVRLRKLLQNSAKLEFWETYEVQEVYEKLMELNKALGEELSPQPYDTVAETKIEPGMSMDEQFAAQKSDEEKAEEEKQKMLKANPVFALLTPAYSYDGRGQVSGLRPGPMVGVCLDKDTAALSSMLRGLAAQRIFGRYTKFLWSLRPVDQSQDAYELIAIRTNRSGKAALWDNVVEDARVENSDWGPQISITMNQFAASDWHKITRENVGKAIAIVIDDQVYSYPTVASEIEGGRASISGNFTKQEAEDFANVLKAGSLPVSLRIVQEEEVAPKH